MSNLVISREAGPAVEEVVPGGVDVVADRADDTEAGDDDAAVVIGFAHARRVPFSGTGRRWESAIERTRVAKGMASRSGAAGSSSGRASASGAIRLMRPVRTRPGPDLDEAWSTPAARIRSTAATQSTPAVRCSTSSARAPSAVVIGRASALARSGAVGSRKSTPARTPGASPSAASAISGEWAATETGRIDDLAGAELLRDRRRRPRSPARSPETTTWPGEFRLATPKTPCGRGPRDELRERARRRGRGSRPSPRRGRRRTPASADRARGRGGRRPRARSRSAATRAEYWPIEWPAAKAGGGRVDAERPPSARGRRPGTRSRRRAAPAGRSRSGRGPRRARRSASRLIDSPSAASAAAKTAAAAGEAAASAWPMPTDCEPWPGNTKADVVIAAQRSAPQSALTRAGLCEIVHGPRADRAILAAHARVARPRSQPESRQ